MRWGRPESFLQESQATDLRTYVVTGPILGLKVVLRCKDFSASRAFYRSVLHLAVKEEWQEDQGRGCVFSFGEEGGLFEIYEMTVHDSRYTPAFSASLASDKIDIQLKTDSVDGWVDRLSGTWPFEGPVTLPWGQRWIKLRDPDNLLIAIYEER